MKKFFALAMAIVSMAAAMTSCNNDEADHVMAPKPVVTETQQPETKPLLTHNVTIGVITIGTETYTLILAPNKNFYLTQNNDIENSYGMHADNLVENYYTDTLFDILTGTGHDDSTSLGTYAVGTPKQEGYAEYSLCIDVKDADNYQVYVYTKAQAMKDGEVLAFGYETHYSDSVDGTNLKQIIDILQRCKTEYLKYSYK